MIMAANSNQPIHSRLWCCLEAFCALEFGIAVAIAGNPLWLVQQDQRERALKAIDVAASAQNQRTEAVSDGMYGMVLAKSAKLELRAAFEDISIKSKDAACYSEDDRRMILALLAHKSDLVDDMIKEQMVTKANDAVVAAVRRLSSTATAVPQDYFSSVLPGEVLA